MPDKRGKIVRESVGRLCTSEGTVYVQSVCPAPHHAGTPEAWEEGVADERAEGGVHATHDGGVIGPPCGPSASVPRPSDS